MSEFLCIDPGSNAMGMALFQGGKLVQVALVTSSKPTLGARIADMGTKISLRADTVVMEYPRIYPGSQKADPNDMLAIAMAGGVAVGAIKPSQLVLISPSDWKGQIAKKRKTSQIIAALTPQDRVILGGCLDHNVLDAVGIGFWYRG